ncbi:class I SAM-dependent methyltransferase [Patescibacteria group bacterium]|nr:class I SAM-dependent methyltransferase [Patescibacteria group bacterium]
MGKNSDTIDYRKDYYQGFSKIYFSKILETLIEFGNLKEEKGVILDYGCGVGHLKKKLPNSNVIGYDILPELTDVADYKVLTPEKIVLSGVLEHLQLEEIENLLKNFIKMNPRAMLLVFLPTENLASRATMRLAGQSNAHDDHISKYKDINALIEKYYYPEKRKYIFLKMAQITKYTPL